MSILEIFRGLSKEGGEIVRSNGAERYTSRAAQTTVAAIVLSHLFSAACAATTSGSTSESKIPSDEPKAPTPVSVFVQPPTPESEPEQGFSIYARSTDHTAPRRFSDFTSKAVCASVKSAVENLFPACLVGDVAATAALDSDCAPDDDGARNARVEAHRIASECRASSDETERAEAVCADAVDVLIIESAEIGDCSKIDKLKDKVVRAWRACLKAAELRRRAEFALQRFYNLGLMRWLTHGATQPDVFSPDRRIRRDSEIPKCLIEGLEGEVEFYRPFRMYFR